MFVRLNKVTDKGHVVAEKRSHVNAPKGGNFWERKDLAMEESETAQAQAKRKQASEITQRLMEVSNFRMLGVGGSWRRVSWFRRTERRSREIRKGAR